jgi:hypothetical protein
MSDCTGPYCTIDCSTCPYCNDPEIAREFDEISHEMFMEDLERDIRQKIALALLPPAGSC